MRIYIFEGVERLTWREHSDGGLVVIAEDEKALHAMIAAHNERANRHHAPERPGPIVLGPHDWHPSNLTVLTVPDNTAPRLWTFPDAGCC